MFKIDTVTQSVYTFTLSIIQQFPHSVSRLQSGGQRGSFWPSDRPVRHDHDGVVGDVLGQDLAAVLQGHVQGGHGGNGA